MRERFAAEETDVADVALVQNVECCGELGGIEAAEIFARHFAVGEIAKIASGIAGISYSTLQSAGPPQAIKRSMSQVLAAFENKVGIEPPTLSGRA